MQSIKLNFKATTMLNALINSNIKNTTREKTLLSQTLLWVVTIVSELIGRTLQI